MVYLLNCGGKWKILLTSNNLMTIKFNDVCYCFQNDFKMDSSEMPDLEKKRSLKKPWRPQSRHFWSTLLAYTWPKRKPEKQLKSRENRRKMENY